METKPLSRLKQYVNSVTTKWVWRNVSVRVIHSHENMLVDGSCNVQFCGRYIQNKQRWTPKQASHDFVSQKPCQMRGYHPHCSKV